MTSPFESSSHVAHSKVTIRENRTNKDELLVPSFLQAVVFELTSRTMIDRSPSSAGRS